MPRHLKVCIAILFLFLTSACTSSSESEINLQTGMPEFLCPSLKDSFEKANTEVWDLATFKTSVKSAQDAVLEVMGQAATISVVSQQPASDWLLDISENGKDFLSYFEISSEGTTEELILIYGRWKTNYEALKSYCP